MQRRIRGFSAGISKELAVSQTPYPSRLIRLEKRGFVERAMAARGQHVKMTKIWSCNAEGG